MALGGLVNRSQDMNPSPKPSQPPAKDHSKPVESPGKENDNLKPEDFPSGDEEDREGGNAGPEEKRKP